MSITVSAPAPSLEALVSVRKPLVKLENRSEAFIPGFGFHVIDASRRAVNDRIV